MLINHKLVFYLEGIPLKDPTLHFIKCLTWQVVTYITIIITSGASLPAHFNALTLIVEQSPKQTLPHSTTHSPAPLTWITEDPWVTGAVTVSKQLHHAIDLLSLTRKTKARQKHPITNKKWHWNDAKRLRKLLLLQLAVLQDVLSTGTNTRHLIHLTCVHVYYIDHYAAIRRCAYSANWHVIQGMHRQVTNTNTQRLHK